MPLKLDARNGWTALPLVKSKESMFGERGEPRLETNL
jgi:hypothetical protein